VSQPNVLFEISWEVCNMVGGIHTVLATKAANMQAQYGNRYVAIGPDISRMEGVRPVFREEIWHAGLHEALVDLDVGCRMGRWLIPGEPRCLLVNVAPLHAQKDAILARYWEWFQLDSITGGWDYFEPVLFGYAAGMVIERLASAYYLPRKLSAVVHAHEWLAGTAVLYLRQKAPEVGTVFTTHATVLGRALAGNRPDTSLYRTLDQVDPGETARALGVMAKHSLESVTARVCDTFTTVSELTAAECARFLGRQPDLVTTNGLGDDFPPPSLRDPHTVLTARDRLFALAELATGTAYDRDQTEIVVSSGRYEFVNKGVDVFLDALAGLDHELRAQPGRRILAFGLYLAGHAGPKRALLQAQGSGEAPEAPETPYLCTHDLHDEAGDPVLQKLRAEGLLNRPENRVHFIFVPANLDGNDALVRETYDELLAGADLSVFPSFYEPWGYTPMESIALGVPTVTSDLAGFGRWAGPRGDWLTTGVDVLPREGRAFEHVSQDLVERVLAYLGLSAEACHALSAAALATSQDCRWRAFAGLYFEAHLAAARLAEARARTMPKGRFAGLSHLQVVHAPAGREAAHLRRFTVQNAVPPELAGLRDLAANLWWSWQPAAEALFADLDPELWDEAGRNPVPFLERVSGERLAVAAGSPDYLARLEAVLAAFEPVRERAGSPEIAYFCMEFGLIDSLRLYSGGLGVLAGDHLKTASDLGLPLCAVGLAYRYGYFRQRIHQDGSQEALREPQSFQHQPMTLVTDAKGRPVTVEVALPGGPVYVRAWRVAVGRVDLYLLDTDLEANRADDRAITDALYGGDQRHRVRQELVLGLGGVRLLQALGIQPKVFHMNEGHSAFLALARLADLSQRGLKWDEALEYVRHTTVFTTHTPVAAGHDAFPDDMVRPYLAPFEPVLQIDAGALLALGKAPWADREPNFSMTALAVQSSGRINGVSRIHGGVSRQLFRDLYPGLSTGEVPVGAITNGVHVPTWLAPEMQRLFDTRLPGDWREHLADAEYWDAVRHLDARDFWQVRLACKRRLTAWLERHIRQSWVARREHPAALAETLRRLGEDTLLVGFARRFAPYKRAELLFRDVDRLARLVAGDVPIVFLFAGKAHPSDGMGTALVREVVEHTRRDELMGRVLFLEDYGMRMASLMVAGCDVWLNTPTRPMEASGTSGIKAAINGCVNLSVRDGWWAEGYNGRNGWSIDDVAAEEDRAYQDRIDSAALYAMFEREVVPRFTGRAMGGLPFEWVEMAKESVASIIPRFSSARMVGEYRRQLYKTAARDAEALAADDYGRLFQLGAFRQRIRNHWDGVAFADLQIEGLDDETILIDQPIQLHVELRHPHLRPEDLAVQAVLAPVPADGQIDAFEVHDMALVDVHAPDGPDAASAWRATLTCERTGAHSLGVRVMPAGELPGGDMAGGEVATFMPLVKWL